MPQLNAAMAKIIDFDNTFRVLDCIGGCAVGVLGYMYTATPAGAILASSPFITKAFERAITQTLIETECITERKVVAHVSTTLATVIALVTAIALLSIFGIEITTYNLALTLACIVLPCWFDTFLSMTYSLAEEDPATESPKNIIKIIDQTEILFKEMLTITKFSADITKKDAIEKAFEALANYRERKSKQDGKKALIELKKKSTIFSDRQLNKTTLSTKEKNRVHTLYLKFQDSQKKLYEHLD